MKRLLSTQEAAEYLGIKVGTLQKWVSLKKIEYVKLGRLTRFSPQALDTFIAERTVHTENV